VYPIMPSSTRRWPLPATALAAAVALVTAGCHRDAPPEAAVVPDVKAAERIDVPHVPFADITTAAGIRFRHTNGAFGQKLLPETMGGGVAFIDFDRDGKQDLLFINSCWWPGHEGKGPAPTLALYRNKGNDAFEDVTKEAGLDLTFYGMGVTVGDYDNDGWPDLFVTGVGGNHLFHNEAGPDGKRRFVEVTKQAGVGGPGGWPANGADFLAREEPINWSTSAAFLDYDGDGRLDLFVCNYVSWSPALDLRQGFRLEGLGRAYGPPTAFAGSHCFLYRNRGDGTFEDVTEKAGMVVQERGQDVGKSLGVTVCDVDGDGRPDIIVANDTVRNFFFHNKGDGTFEEIGVPSGVAFAEPRARGAMGPDSAWYRPGVLGVVIGNFADEPDTFLRLDNPKALTFFDAALAEGISRPSRQRLKFGTLFRDFDLDGAPDLLTNNGHLEPEISKVQPSQTYAQAPQLFWNAAARRRFAEVTEREAGTDLFVPLVGRGCAYADIDGDGDLDLVLMGNGGPARLLRNDGKTGHHWIRLALEGDGKRSNRSAIGARVTVEAGGKVQQAEVASSRGYLSASELPLTFGLGDAAKVDRVTIRWPGKDGGQQVLEGLGVDRVHTVRQKVP
ncbi:MAG TPA: CRTAC1 family protein, partial [Gemmataceae bacterium]|nr:CRTAC1 family protein [Gemmataceae bacterium]